MEVQVDVSKTSFRAAAVPGRVVRLKYPGWDIAAETIAVIPAADRAKATVRVRAGFKQKEPRIMPDMV